MKNAISAIILILGAFLPAVAHSESRVVFREGGRECSLDYDTGIFMKSSLDSENYRRFSGPNKHIYFRVTAFANEENLTPVEIRKEYILRKGKKDLVYDSIKDQFLVLSGYRGKDIFYTKISLSPNNQTICVLDIFYPRAARRAFDSQVTRMSLSFVARR